MSFYLKSISYQTTVFVVHVDYGISSPSFTPSPNDIIRSLRGQVIVFEDFRDQDDLIRRLRVLRRRRQGQSWPDNVIRSLRGLSHCLRGLSCNIVQVTLSGHDIPRGGCRSPRGLRRPSASHSLDLEDDTVVYVDYEEHRLVKKVLEDDLVHEDYE